MVGSSFPRSFYWTLQVVGWSLYGLLGIVMSSIYDRFVPRLLLTECVVVATMLLLSHCLRQVVQRLSWVQLPIKQLVPRLLAVHTGLAVVSQGLMWLLLTLVLRWVLHLPFSYPHHLLLAYVLQAELVFFMWSSLYFGLHYLANYRQAGIEKWRLAATLNETEAARWKLAATLREAEMRTLKAQINPHFMFNGLNNIRFLVMDNPARARRMITHLADLLRYSIQLNSTEQVTLAQELQIVEYYLELEAVQLEERLTFSLDVDAAAQETLIPHMTLQLLVENAIKHGLSPLPADYRSQYRQVSAVCPWRRHWLTQCSRATPPLIWRASQPDHHRRCSCPWHRHRSPATPTGYPICFSSCPAMTTLLVDDSRPARVELRLLLQAFPDVQVVGEAKNIVEAETQLRGLVPDVVFLDIEMPGGSGFDLFAALNSAPRVIFTTAYNEYAVRAFEHNALDYLLKPIEESRLATALGKARLQLGRAAEAAESSPLSAQEQVFVKDGERCWFVRLADIRLFEIQGSYTQIYFDQHRPLLPRTLQQLESRLDPKVFFRVNRQQIINLQWVESITPWFSHTLKIKIKDGPEVKLSRKQSILFRELLSL
jgi:two-component system LytT family response regulator